MVMIEMIPREARVRVAQLLARAPAVVLTGPRQVGKTTVAMEFVRERKGAYLDLEDPRDRAKLADVHKYCDRNADRLVVLDEIHRVPGLFEPLRGIIDRRRREGRRTGHFLLLGSASVDLLRQTGETLAGRVAYCEMQPLNVREAAGTDMDDLWQRGGMPESLLAAYDTDSFEWRFDFIRTYLERDIPALGPRIPRETLRRFWTMLAHDQGQSFNAAVLARSLGLSGRTVGRYLDLMVDLLLVRRLPSWRKNVGKRLVKAPKAYLRDSGICHALLGIASFDALLGHPVAGGSWEGFVIESILSGLPAHVSYAYYRSTGGAEIDLVLELGGGEVWAVEIKRSSAPKVSRGFHTACDDVKPDRRLVVHGGDESYPLRDGIEAVALRDICGELAPGRANQDRLSTALRVDPVSPGEGMGRIGITLCPGKTDPRGMTRAWKRDLSDDLDAIRDWGAAAVVTLITDEEMESLRVQGLGQGVRGRQMEWWHLPIPDGHAPGEDFEARWVEASAAIRSHLRSGRDVLVHCKGGLGRAGTIAARLMVELGTQPEDAIRLVRESRSRDAIETRSQEAHVRSCRAL